MEIAGKTPRHRLLAGLAVLIVLVLFDTVTGSPVEWSINLSVSVLYVLFSLTIDVALERWRAKQE
ncbi:MAG: hypothetical protein ACOCSD_01390 [Halolamina sp.]